MNKLYHTAAIGFDTVYKNIHSYITHKKCHNTDMSSTFKNDMEELNLQMIASNAIIFISLIYYYTLDTQIKGNFVWA